MSAALGWVVAVLLTAVDAPVVEATVYGDRARVVREAIVEVRGATTVELPLVEESADLDTLRVEADGARVERIELRRAARGEFPPSEARRLLAELDAADDALARVRAEREVVQTDANALAAMEPQVRPPSEGQPPVKLDPSAWQQAQRFLAERIAALDRRELDLRAEQRRLEFQRLVTIEETKLAGGARDESGYRVLAHLGGDGRATVRLSYVVPRARWVPAYELQLSPESSQVRLSFYALVSQETGSDWREAKLTLSTAVPQTARTLPSLRTWKLGERERFIPSAAPLREFIRPAAAPVTPQSSAERRDAEELARRTGVILERPQVELRAPRSADAVALARRTGLVAAPPQLELQAPQSASERDVAVALRPSSSPVGQGSAVITGTVVDAASKQPLSDVVVTATSPSMQGEQIVVTDDTGYYRIPQLPSGVYLLRFEREGYKLFGRDGVTLRQGVTVRVNLELLPEGITEDIVVVGRPPTVDVGSTTTGVNVSSDFLRMTGLAGVAPGTRSEAYGVSNGLQLDGVSVDAPREEIAFTPPPGYQAPQLDPRSPAALAGGYDLAFSTLRPESVESGKGLRRLPLFSETWPVKLERKLVPALSPYAYLVAELDSPSKRVLPAGHARLFVGQDPAGEAELKLIAPGQRHTLPLGVDRAVKATRNVELLQSVKGLILKDDVGDYRVKLEVANPYPTPIAIRVQDQWPLKGNEHVEVKLRKVTPAAQTDPVKGSLEWTLTIPANGKVELSFEYELRRPKDAQLLQQEGP